MASNNNNAGGRRPGAGNYSIDENIQHFLTIMDDVLPIGPEEWDDVVARHAVNFPGRDVDSIRRKFSTLHRNV